MQINENIAQSLRTNMLKVEFVLERHERARDSDKFLYLVFLRVFFDIEQLHNSNFDQFSAYIMQKKVPTPETISRARRKIQEAGKWLGKRQLARKQEASAVADWAVNG